LKQTLTKTVISITAILTLCSTVTFAEDLNKTIIPTKHNPKLTLGQIAEITPGMGTIMMEYGHRFYVTYYAAKASNWGLAQYELKEMLEIQEVGEVTRPEHTDNLKAFESDYLDKVVSAAEEKDWKKFTQAYGKAIKGCNACHTKTGHPYIRYRVPERAPKLLQIKVER
jgi:hypothetical protein